MLPSHLPQDSGGPKSCRSIPCAAFCAMWLGTLLPCWASWLMCWSTAVAPILQFACRALSSLYSSSTECAGDRARRSISWTCHRPWRSDSSSSRRWCSPQDHRPPRLLKWLRQQQRSSSSSIPCAHSQASSSSSSRSSIAWAGCCPGHFCPTQAWRRAAAPQPCACAADAADGWPGHR